MYDIAVQACPQIVVLSYKEIIPGINVETLGRIEVDLSPAPDPGHVTTPGPITR